MSGTSLDGVDAALIETDGHGHVRPLKFVTLPYAPALREEIRACFGKRVGDDEVTKAARALTLKHIEAVKLLMESFSLHESLSPHPNPLPQGERGKIDVIGFHGQTITHDPATKFTLQIGDADLLARDTGVDVVYDFRSADIKAGGQGAPLLPLYHQARAGALPMPIAVLNIGGVANVTYINGNEILAFDTGPGNALIDDWMKKHKGEDFDEDGMTAAGHEVDAALLKELLSHEYFNVKPPKSLDRNAFHDLCDADIATLSMFTVESIKKGRAWLPQKPSEWIVAGGGRKNGFLMRSLARALDAPVKAVEAYGWNGDALEAEGFAYLAVRSLLGEPLSLPTTTGVPKPQAGGVLVRA